LPDGAFWHPFADMSSVAGHEFVLVSGDGAVVTDSEGREYVDASAALWYCNVGHGRREIADAAAAQMTALASYSTFGDNATAPTIELAERIAHLSGVPGAKVFFTSGGSDAVDTAVKLVRRYWSLVGQPSRQWIITRDRAYHGMHMAGTSLAGIAMNKDGYGDLDAKVANVAWDSADALEEAITRIGAENVGAFFCEPVIGAGGVYPPPDDYLESVRDICRRHGVLFVADEVICGFGRVGRWFGSQRWSLDPDLILIAKGMTSGYVPMGAVIVADRVAEPFWTTPGFIWRHGYTYSGHATAAAAALANLAIIEREHLVERVAKDELTLAAALLPLRPHSHVHDVRAGTGLLGAVQLNPEWLAQEPGAGMQLVREVRARGVLTRLLSDGGLQVSPPFVITRQQMQQVAQAFDDALRAMGSTVGRVEPDDRVLLPQLTGDEQGGFGSNAAELRANVPPHHGS
jgi:putrescine---pyruvate transaminase